jgi:beta-glucosidase
VSIHTFPEDFLWGVATSSFQIEGATDAEGRGESIWDRFCTQPGAVKDGTDGSVACDHYNRYPADVQMMADLGMQSYRFSIAWPRVLPRGYGAVNEPGLAFYDRLVDALLEKGIRPFVTLYHWDMPQALQDAGGWPARDTAKAFAEYADVVSRRLGDRVNDWITHNEPWCISVLGHQNGEHAPGHTSLDETLRTSHHLLLSHGWSVPVIRRNVPGADVGITLNLLPGGPASPSAADEAAWRHLDGTFNRWFLDPLYSRGYPEDIVQDYLDQGELTSKTLPFVEPGDMEAIATPTDFLGINYYSRAVVRSDKIPEAENLPVELQVPPDAERTDMDWEVYPKGLYDLLMDVHKTYEPPVLYVTENGAAYAQGPDETGAIDDQQRLRYLRDHFIAARAAIAEGAPLAGYFVWSLMDNFEWAHGYEKRFGIVWVDYETLERTPKASALWYRDVIGRNGLAAEEGE